MAWVKAFHLVFMVTWFAGLFYLPRLFVYHATCEDEPGHRRFCIMERRLAALMTLGGALTLLFGFWLLFGWWWPIPPGHGWLHLKLLLVALLVAYHAWCLVLVRRFREGRNTRGHGWYRWFNEAPSVLLIAIVVLAVVKPGV